MSSTEWETPQNFFDSLNAEFHFTVDVCASAENNKLPQYWGRQDYALGKDWSHDICWMNPPYNQDIWKWVEKAYLESQKGATVVTLIQGRSTDTKMWHNYVMRSSEICLIKDRLQFKRDGVSARANISSVVVVFRPFCQGPPVVCSIDTKGKFLEASHAVEAT